jgi:hypothetical protein
MKTNQKLDPVMAILLPLSQAGSRSIKGDQLSGAGEEGWGRDWVSVVAMGVAWGSDSYVT